jgi:hypothetical protein
MSQASMKNAMDRINTSGPQHERQLIWNQLPVGSRLLAVDNYNMADC